MVTHPAPPQTRTCAMNAYGASDKAFCSPTAVPWGSGDTIGALAVSLVCQPTAHSARRRLPSRGSRGSHFPTFLGTLRRDDCHPVLLGLLRSSLASRSLACSRAFVVSLAGSCSGGSPAHTPGPLVTRSPSPGSASRRPMALPRSRVPPLKICPALRPRWGPAHAPYRTQDCGLPAHANRRLPTTRPIAGLNDAADLLAPPGSVRPFTGRHAGSLLTCWLDVRQVGLAPHSPHPLGNNNPFHGLSPSSKVSGLPWREHAVVRLRI
jgi:hypothetical protein